MASWSNLVITKKGTQMLAGASAGGQLKFMRVCAGDGSLAAGELPEDMETLKHELVSVLPSSVGATDAQVELVAPFGEQFSGLAFDFRELGVFASVGGDEFLLAYGNSGDAAERIDATDNTAVERVLKLIFTFSSELSVSLQTDPQAYVTHQDKATNLQYGIVRLSDQQTIRQPVSDSVASTPQDIKYLLEDFLGDDVYINGLIHTKSDIGLPFDKKLYFYKSDGIDAFSTQIDASSMGGVGTSIAGGEIVATEGLKVVPLSDLQSPVLNITANNRHVEVDGDTTIQGDSYFRGDVIIDTDVSFVCNGVTNFNNDVEMSRDLRVDGQIRSGSMPTAAVFKAGTDPGTNRVPCPLVGGNAGLIKINLLTSVLSGMRRFDVELEFPSTAQDMMIHFVYGEYSIAHRYGLNTDGNSIVMYQRDNTLVQPDEKIFITAFPC